MKTGHPLDRPVWSALTTRQTALSLGNDRARRFAPSYGPLTAAASASARDRAAVAELEIDETGLWFVEADPVEPPPGLAVVTHAMGHQMIATEIRDVPHDFDIVPLDDRDAPEMLALALLTRPGPFSTETHRLADFIGVKQDGRLVGMAGERMQPQGYSEVSGVCTHPDHRGQGYAAALSAVVTRRILERGETPFLHAYAANAGAIRLYQNLGFEFRREMAVTILRKA